MRIGLATFLLTISISAIAGTVMRTANMAVARDFHAATVLADGRVLITGGYGAPTFCGSLCADFPVHQTSEIFDPSTKSFSRTGDMLSPRAGHTSALLADGRVLIANGVPDDGVGNTGTHPIPVAELYDPDRGSFRSTGTMATPRYAARALSLLDGRVLIIGGEVGDNSPAIRFEIYDPVTEKFALTALPRFPHVEPTAVVLRDGRVLIAGGRNGSYAAPPMRSAELFDPSTGTFESTGDMVVARTQSYAMLLADGRAIVIGGGVSKAEVYDPATRQFSAVADVPADGPAFLLRDGRVLIAGPRELHIFDPMSQLTMPAATLPEPRFFPSISVLLDGRVVLAGGYRGELQFHTPDIVATADVFSPDDPPRRRAVPH